MGQPRRIKRYANRKLYDTTAKRYVTLEQIAQLVRAGEEIEVIENDTGADLTSVTLSQILVEQEKKRASRLPTSFLTELVKSSSTLFDQVRRTVTSWMQTAHVSREQIERHLEELVRKGQLTIDEAGRLREELARRTEAVLQLVDQHVDARLRRAVSHLGLVRRSDVEALLERLGSLEARLDAALTERGPHT